MTFVEQTMQTQKLKTCLNTDQTHLQMFYLQAFTEKLKTFNLHRNNIAKINLIQTRPSVF